MSDPSPRASNDDEQQGYGCTTLRDPGLLRATRVAWVLQNAGSILKSSAGTAETFSLSVPVLGIDDFISHNWSTPRWKKFMVLALHFNFCFASCVTLAVLLLLCALTACGLLPTVRYFSWDWFVNPHTFAPYCLVAAVVVMLLMLFFGHEVQARLGLYGRRIFLDKACIHQTDQQLMQDGIRSLAAIVANSRYFLVVYTDTYLQKVWTVYELASALVLLPPGRLVIRSVYLPLLVLSCTALEFVAVALEEWVKMHEKHAGLLNSRSVPIVTNSLNMLQLLWYSAILRIWAKRRARIELEAQQFSIRKAVCSIESDRALVQSNIAAFMREFGFVRADAPMRGALDAFDALVSRVVPDALLASFGRTGMPYHFVALACGLAHLGRTFDLSAAMIHEGTPLWKIAIAVADALTWHLSVWPNVMASCSWMVSFLTHWSGLGEWAFVVVLALGNFVLIQLFQFVVVKTIRVGHAYTPAMAAYLSYMPISFLLTYLLYRPWQPTHALTSASRSEPGEAPASTGTPEAAGPKHSSATDVGHLFRASLATMSSYIVRMLSDPKPCIAAVSPREGP